MEKINIAVLISVYRNDNSELFYNALQSIINQKLPANFVTRIYLGVDGPIDSELESVIECSKGHIYYTLRSLSNIGLAAILNKLIQHLNNETLIFRMDSDDISMPDRFISQINFLNDHPDVDIVGTDIIEIDVVSNIQRIVSFAIDHDDAIRKIPLRVPVAHPTVCFRRHVFSLVPQYPHINGNEDIAMWFACINKGLRFGNVHTPLLKFTINQNFWSRRSFSKSVSEFHCYCFGIWKMHKLTWLYIFPFIRLLVRLSPQWVSKFLYYSKIRSRQLKNICL